MKKQIFKPYKQNRSSLLPPNLEELIPPDHIVRVVDEIIERIDIEPLIRQYKGGGTSAYHPKMMFKVIIYAYSQQIFSSRQIAKALRENINFMWLSGMNRPDHRTINRFRGKIMKGVIDEVFYAVVEKLLDQGCIDLEKFIADGAKLEANPNKYSSVWGKSTEKYKSVLQGKVRDLLDEIDELEAEEDSLYGGQDLDKIGEGKEIDSEKLKEVAEKINQKLQTALINNTLKKDK